MASPRMQGLMAYIRESEAGSIRRDLGTTYESSEDDMTPSKVRRTLKVRAPGSNGTRERSGNRVLGDPSVREELRPHRVAMSMWYIDQAAGNDPRVGTIDKLFGHMRDTGYDGCEITAECFQKKYFYGTSLEETARNVREVADKYGMKIFGSLYHSLEWQWKDEKAYIAYIREQMAADKILGSEYATYQVFLSDEYMGCGSDYTDDTAYMTECVRRINVLKKETLAAGLNFYLETHVDRITQDPRAVCRFLDKTSFEMNGDLAHYITLGLRSGASLERTLATINHMHVRMARMYGDISVGPENPERDWDDRGVTWTHFNYAIPAMKGGLSSRVLVEETGPIHEVSDPLTAGAKLLPLLRAMAKWCDNEARGHPNPSLVSPSDLRPFAKEQ
eukprot:TRINITY_DN4376_c1_g1_i1.p2 TRINITY_DN4376_c1_g1~~TRINITY_DN4376_c1_g1_i1.p2  ORF type:complete len:390 (+),score=133.15 TRINITY_DN4376_c1_g1_i1:2070-3239(+)